MDLYFRTFYSLTLWCEMKILQDAPFSNKMAKEKYEVEKQHIFQN